MANLSCNVPKLLALALLSMESCSDSWSVEYRWNGSRKTMGTVPLDWLYVIPNMPNPIHQTKISEPRQTNFISLIPNRIPSNLSGVSKWRWHVSTNNCLVKVLSFYQNILLRIKMANAPKLSRTLTNIHLSKPHWTNFMSLIMNRIPSNLCGVSEWRWHVSTNNCLVKALSFYQNALFRIKMANVLAQTHCPSDTECRRTQFGTKNTQWNGFKVV